MMMNEAGNLFGKFSRRFNNVRYMFFFDVKAFISDIDLTNEGNHFIENTATFFYGHVDEDLFFSNNGASMNA